MASWAAFATLNASALEIRNYNATDHDRFLGFSANPSHNPDNLFAHLDLSGVAWFVPNPDVQFALITRQHVVFASHFLPAIGSNQIRFLDPSGQIVTRSLTVETVVDDGGTPSDVAIITLNTPIDASEDVAPLPYLDLPSGNDYESLDIGIIGWTARTGADSINDVENSPRIPSGLGLNETRFMRFDYRPSSGGDDECYFQPNDSGSPTFVETGGKAALVGVHSYVDQQSTPPFNIRNYDAFLPHYVGEIDALIASSGYRMRPVNAASTTLGGSISIVESTPRRALPLTLEFTIENTGAETTGNLEVEFHFAAGEEPDSVTAAGWVTYGGGSKWTLRKATMDPADTEVLTASWAAAPSVDSFTPTFTWRSDTVADQSSSPVINLAPSFTDWASGLSEPGETDDPDLDMLVNLLEYAFGGDPEDGLAVLPNGEALLPTVTYSSGTVTISHPERSDKAARGLAYVPEWSTELTAPSWSTTPPVGVISSTAPYAPDVPGFVRRSISWPTSEDRQFVRIGVTLNE
ncbi:MAG: trypsin-like serine protease [Verrucomicrobiota bacterium]